MDIRLNSFITILVRRRKAFLLQQHLPPELTQIILIYRGPRLDQPHLDSRSTFTFSLSKPYPSIIVPLLEPILDDSPHIINPLPFLQTKYCPYSND
jgi:hypothetical protein